MQETKNDLVVRHNKLINSKIRLNAKEYDVVRTFMKLITKDDADFWTFSISAKDVGVEYKRGKHIVKSIGRKPLEIDLGEQNFTSIPFFSILKYKDGYFHGKFNNDLRDMLMLLKNGNFTKTYEKYILPLESIYTKRLYELLTQYKDFRGYRKFVLTDLQNTLQVSKSMMDYPNFKKKVLIPSVREINKHTDIYLDLPLDDLQAPQWVNLQCGRKRGIRTLNFKIEVNKKNLFKEDEIKNEDIKDFDKFKDMFTKFKFDTKEFAQEIESFKIYNDNKIEKITLENFKKWCMQKKRKTVNVTATKTTNQEQDTYKWEFKKAKAISDKIKEWLEFDIGIDWLNDYYLKDIKEFEVDGKNFSYQDVMHPHLNKEEILLYKLDDDNGQYLLKYKSDDVIDAVLIEKRDA